MGNSSAVCVRGEERESVSLRRKERDLKLVLGDATIATSERKCIGKVRWRFDRRKVAETLSRHPPPPLLRILYPASAWVSNVGLPEQQQKGGRMSS